MPGILDNPVGANPILQIDPNANTFHAVGPGGILGSMQPRTFYRGTNPGSEQRIQTGDPFWDKQLFMSSSPDAASMYGSQIQQFNASPDAKILYEGTRDFVNTVGRWRKDENLLDFSSRAAQAAKVAGYDAVHFKRQGDVGTVIFNPDKFIQAQ